jgi:hypothetical protein
MDIYFSRINCIPYFQGMASWRIIQDNQSVVTFASVGIRLDYVMPYINAVLNSFAGPNGTPINITNTTTDIQSSSIVALPNILLSILVLLVTMFT